MGPRDQKQQCVINVLAHCSDSRTCIWQRFGIYLVLDVTRVDVPDKFPKKTKKIFFTSPQQVIKRARENNVKIVCSEALLNPRISQR